MGKDKNFSGQPIFNQLIKFMDKIEIRKIAKHHSAERYVKKISTFNHVIVMLFVAFEGYHSIREVILGLLANSHKLSHFRLSYLVRRCTFSEANQRRSSKVFGDIYMSVYRELMILHTNVQSFITPTQFPCDLDSPIIFILFFSNKSDKQNPSWPFTPKITAYILSINCL